MRPGGRLSVIDVVDEEVERLGAVDGQRAGVVGEGGGGCHVGVLRVVGDGDVADAEDLDGRALTEDAALELSGEQFLTATYSAFSLR